MANKARRNNKIRNAARGQECTLQLFPYCTLNPETVVFCHMDSPDNGIGLKASYDFWGAFGCYECHKIADGAHIPKDITPEEILQAKLRGIYRTQKLLMEMGIIIIK